MNNAVLVLDPNGSFTARPHTIGATVEEIRAIEAGELPRDRVATIAENMHQAAYALSQNTAGHC